MSASRSETRTSLGFQPLELPFPLPAGEHVVQSAALLGDEIVLGIASHASPDAPGEARLLGFRPESGDWRVLHEAELEPREYQKAGVRRTLPFELGLAAMAELDDALYISRVGLRSPALLRYDGRNVTEHAMPDAPFRHLIVWENGLCGAPAGKLTDSLADPTTPCHPLYHSTNPVAEDWHEISEPGFGDASNQLVSGLGVYGGQLAAAVANPVNGFQLWVCNRNLDNYEWEQWLDQGAMQYAAAPAAASLAVFAGALYLGSGLPQGLSDPGSQLKPAELLRLDAPGEWESIMGEPRFSPAGLQVPLSARAAGFDQKDQISVTALGAFEGALYAATAPRQGGPFQLWRAADPSDWQCLSRNNLGEPGSGPLRALLATPWGLLAAGAWRNRAPSPRLGAWLSTL